MQLAIRQLDTLIGLIQQHQTRGYVGDIVEYSPEEMGSMVEKYAGDAAMMAWIDESNDHDPDFLFPEEDEDEMEESSSEEELSSSDEESDTSSDESVGRGCTHRPTGRPKRNAGSYKMGPAKYDRRRLSFLVE